MSFTNLRPDDLDDYRTVVIALTGPPAAGKSTVAEMIGDHGIPVKDTGDAIREEAHRRCDDPTEDQVWEVAELIREEHGPAGPTATMADWIAEKRGRGNELVCVSSLREQAEVDWLRENVGPTLVIRIDADDHARTKRYVDMKLDDDEDQNAVSQDRVHDLRMELYDREYREMPYPSHDVEIMNEDSVQLSEIYRRLGNVIEVIEA